MAYERKSFLVKWRIEKFRSWLQKQEDVLYSPSFTVETMFETKWRLSLSLKCGPTSNYMALALLREDGGPELVDLEYELSFLANDETSLNSGTFTNRIGRITSRNELRVKIQTILIKKRNNYLHEENLKVSCLMWRKRSIVTKIGRCLILTVIGMESMIVDGIIENFSNLSKCKYRTVNLISPSTGLPLISLYFHWNGSDLKFEKVPLAQKVKFVFIGQVFIVDAVGNKKEAEKVSPTNYYCPLSYSGYTGFSLHTTMEELTANDFLRNDILTLRCEIAICPGIELENIEYEFLEKNDSNPSDLKVCNFEENKYAADNIQQSEVEDTPNAEKGHAEFMISLQSDMAFLYNDKLFCDTLLQTGSEIFPAHRNVLSARSPVFKKMFTADMKEKTNGINIPDLSSDIVRRMLLFIYTDTTDDLDWENVKELYFAADKYEILTLKRRCSHFIRQNLTPLNVGEILVLADRHQDDDLKSTVQEFILEYDQEVFNSSEWKVFMENYCHLAAQIMYTKCLQK